MPAPTLSINLMNEYVRQVKRRKMLFTKVQFYAAGVLIIYGACLAIVLIYRGVLAVQLELKEKAIEKEIYALTQLKPLEDKYLYVQNKLSLVADFWGSMTDTRSKLVQVLSYLPTDVQLEAVVYSVADETVKIDSVAKDVFVAKNWLNSLEDQIANTTYKKITVESLTREKDGTYHISVILYVSKEG